MDEGLYYGRRRIVRKKILFIISNLQTGGVSKSMTSLVNVVDRKRYDVSLMIVSPNGPFMELLPTDLRLITNPVWTALTGHMAGLWYLLKSRHLLLALGHCFRLLVGLFSKAAAGEMIAAMMPGIDEEFDTIVDFNGQQQCYYMVNKLKARKKITFFHSDYKKWPFYYSSDKKYFPLVDSIWTISETCVDSLKVYFPALSEKIRLMENITSLDLIEKMSLQFVPDDIRMDIPTIVTVGHVCEGKGSHWAIESAAILKRKGLNFRWYFIGSNPDKEYYNRLCKQFDVADRIVFSGIKINPYPYMRAATIVVHPSQYEGKSIALDETKLLCKPVVVTNFSTVKDQFSDRCNASICEMNPESIAHAVEELISDEKLRSRYASALLEQRRDNVSEVDKLYAVFDD